MAWFAKALADPDREILIAENDGKSIGMVRLDREDAFTSVHILLAPDSRGKGLASPVLSGAIESSRVESTVLRATVRAENLASLKLFKGLGFAIVEDGGIVVLERTLA